MEAITFASVADAWDAPVGFALGTIATMIDQDIDADVTSVVGVALGAQPRVQFRVGFATGTNGDKLQDSWFLDSDTIQLELAFLFE